MAIEIENRDPASAAVDVPYTTNVYFELVDHVAGSVTLNKVTVTVDGEIVYQGSVEKSGWTVVVTSITDGYSFNMVPPTPFSYSSTVLVHIEITS